MSKSAIANDLPPEELDDSINLESKVLLALSRLQNTKNACKKPLEDRSVSCSNIVRFLKANYSWLDGDIQSQVKTALLSFIKMGIVCILENSKYRLLVPNPKVMTNTCLTRANHGPECCCLFTLKCMLSESANICCMLKQSDLRRRKMQKRNKKKTIRKSQKMKSSFGKNQKTKCYASKNDSFIETRKQNYECKCSYCIKGHAHRSKKMCKTCNPLGYESNIPFDTFSPRDEVIETC